MWDNTLVLGFFENTKIRMRIMGESALTHAWLPEAGFLSVWDKKSTYKIDTNTAGFRNFLCIVFDVQVCTMFLFIFISHNTCAVGFMNKWLNEWMKEGINFFSPTRA